MRVCRERRQMINVELGLPEAVWLAEQLAEYVRENFTARGGSIADQLRQRLERHVKEAKEGARYVCGG